MSCGFEKSFINDIVYDDIVYSKSQMQLYTDSMVQIRPLQQQSKATPFRHSPDQLINYGYIQTKYFAIEMTTFDKLKSSTFWQLLACIIVN